ncbi:MAG: hypothetical protein LBD60_00585 [Puniceicoccales bacterium]|jgi:hypothetical protein|nr:hypothetical protein [Puniceicoccales bacterium]
MKKLHKKILSVGFGCFISAVSYTAASDFSGKEDERLRPLARVSWTSEENERLRLFVSQHGTKWSEVAALMPNRNAKQCREQWEFHLNPLPPTLPWAPGEDHLLMELVEQYGPKWDNISVLIAGNRSGNSCKNRWNQLKLKPAPDRPMQQSAPDRPMARAFPRVPAVPQALSPFLQGLALQGLKMEWNLASAFKENLCGYSALLAAQKINAIAPGTGGDITITYTEVCQFARNLMEKIPNIDVPLNMEFLGPIAQCLGWRIILDGETPYGSFTRDFNPNATITVRIYLCSSGACAHYQVITPQNVTVHYEDDYPQQWLSKIYPQWFPRINPFPGSSMPDIGFSDFSDLTSFFATT